MLPVAPPSKLLGLLCAAVVVGLTTALVFPLRTVAPVVSLGVVYLVAVLLISTVWDAWLGVLTAIASALAFNYFHIPPTGRFTIAESEHWVALVVFPIVATSPKRKRAAGSSSSAPRAGQLCVRTRQGD